MRQIFKNYLTTFIKNWLQTIGTILFILMMFAVVIGFLAAPLQIYAKTTSMNNKNKKYDQIINDNKFQFGNEFLYKFAYDQKNGDLAQYTQLKTNDGHEIDGQGLTLVTEQGVNESNSQILSPIFKAAVAEDVQNDNGGSSTFKNDSDMYDSYGRYIESGIEAFRDGALLDTNVHFSLSSTASGDDATAKAFADNIEALVANYLVNSPEGMQDISTQSRVLGLITNVFSTSGFTCTASDLANELNKLDGGSLDPKVALTKFDDALLNVMRNDMTTRGVTKQDVDLLASQVFNIDPTASHKMSNGVDLYYSSSMFAKLTDPTYSYNFANYIEACVLNTYDNTNAFNGTQRNYNYQIEKTMFYSQTTLGSLFPTLSVVLGTVNNGDTNQIQLESGRLPTKVDANFANRNDALDAVMNDNALPEVVVTSGFANKNKLKIGDTITLPDAPEDKNVTDNTKTSSDKYLTTTMKYKIVGIGEKFDDVTPGSHFIPFMEKVKTYTTAYVDDGWYSILMDSMWANSSSSASAFKNNFRITNAKGVKASAENAFNINMKDDNAKNAIYDGGSPFVAYKDTATMQQVNSTKIKVIIFIILGIAVLVLAFVFINFIITKELNETRRQIGIFKSFGYKISELSWIFAVKTFLTIFVGAVLGYVVSIGIQVWSASTYINAVMFKWNTIYAGAGIILIIFLAIPAVFLILSYIMTIFYLREPTLSLLANGAKVKSGRNHQGLIVKHLSKVGKGFGYRLQQGFIKDSMGKFVVVQILFAIASLTFTLMFGAQDLMYSIANQGFSVLKKNTDHRYGWTNQDQINIDYGKDNSYNFDNKQKWQDRGFEYVPYKDEQNIGSVVDASGKASDSRYRENYLISSISNTFDKGSLKAHAMDLLMPLDYYLISSGAVAQQNISNDSSNDNLVNTVTRLVGNDPSKQFLIDAAKTDAENFKSLSDKPASLASATSNIMVYSDYYLNWILSFRIKIMPTDASDGVEGVTSIIKNLKNANDSDYYDINSLEKYATDWNNKAEPIKIDMSQIGASGPSTDVLKEFQDTLFGLSAKDNDGKNNNLFLADITKILTLKMAEAYGTNIYTKDLGGSKDPQKVYKALQSVGSDSVMSGFSPNNMKYWGLNSPLTKSMLQGPTNGNSNQQAYAKYMQLAASTDSSTGGISISRMSQQSQSLIMAASLLGYNSPNLDSMPVITLNQAFYNPNKDALLENIPVTNVDDSQDSSSSISLFDYSNDKYGTYDTVWSHKGVSDDTYKHLKDDAATTEYPDLVNVVIPYGLARSKKLKVGDIYTCSTDTKQKRTVHMKVIGINKSVTFALGGGWSIDCDYNQFANKYFSDDLNKAVNPALDGTSPMFNAWTSTDPMLQGKINLKDIPGSVNSMKFVGKDLSISIDPSASVFGSIFTGMIQGLSQIAPNTDSTFRLITNPNVATMSKMSNVAPYNILKAGVNNGISEINDILIVFMCLVAVMLLIILVVVMNIIIEQATPIILTLKSLGYNQKEINWITMGGYIIWAIFSFVIAYILSLVIWNVFIAIAGSAWHIYVFMTYSWKAPVITFLVVGAILFIGWLVSDHKVQKIPLTLVTGFN